MESPATPELDKMRAVRDASQCIGAFLDTLSHEGIELCERDARGELQPLNQSIEVTLAKYFDIDLAKVERERRALLASIRS